MKQKSSNKGKTLMVDCVHHEHECDMMGCKYSWCHNSDCGHRECPATWIYEMMKCPFYGKGEKRGFITMTDQMKKQAEAFRQKMLAEIEAKESSEKALYLKLKQKYEGTDVK